MAKTASAGKIVSRAELPRIVQDLKSQGKRVVFTNGCFDLIHGGHIHLLRTSRLQGDCLIAALNSDDSIRRIKDKGRPILDEGQRGRVVSSFEMVDYVVFFDEDTPEDLIREVKPDVLVKGGDYPMEGVVGRQQVWDNGGEVAVVKPQESHSTTQVIQEILARFGK